MDVLVKDLATKMPVTAKICGLSTPETLDAAIAGGASHVGFVFFPPSPRNVDFDQARALASHVPGHVARSACSSIPTMRCSTPRSPPGSTLQLHKVTPERAAAIRAHRPRGLGGRRGQDRADLAAPPFAGAADRILYDAKTPDSAALPGGMGLRFDWTCSKGYRHPLPWALSGGLDPCNVDRGDPRHRRHAGRRLLGRRVRAPGVKDVDKIAAFLKAVAQC
jgi:phosphoribosylanthranilate isomerase